MSNRYSYLYDSLQQTNEDLKLIIWILAFLFLVILFRNWYNRYKKNHFKKEMLQLQKEVLKQEKLKETHAVLLREHKEITRLNEQKQTAINELQNDIKQLKESINKTNFEYQHLLKEQKVEFEHQKKAIEKYAHYKAIDANNTRLGAHFIKNVINHVYLDLEEEKKPILTFFGLSIYNENESQKKLPISILKKIYKLLDYNVAAVNKDKVSIKEELFQLQNFGKVLEYMKPYAKIQFTNMLKEEDLKNLKIKPTILFPFLENALKHGNLNDEQSFVTVQLKKSTTEQFIYAVENSYEEDTATIELSTKPSFGLTALKKLLEAYYPLHNLKHGKTKDKIYNSQLTINLSSC